MTEATVKDNHEQGTWPDNWWWLIVRNPAQEIHLYELGYDEPAKATGGKTAKSAKDAKDGEDDEKAKSPLTPERRTQILTELGAPVNEDGTLPDGWDLQMFPGRPDPWIEPKTYDHEGNLTAIRAKAGVTLHLLPESEPGTPAEDESTE
jgi:hypothetical protein